MDALLSIVNLLMSPSKTLSLSGLYFLLDLSLRLFLSVSTFLFILPICSYVPMCSHRALGVFMEVVLNSWPDYLHTPASHKSDSGSYYVPPESMALNLIY